MGIPEKKAFTRLLKQLFNLIKLRHSFKPLEHLNSKLNDKNFNGFFRGVELLVRNPGMGYIGPHQYQIIVFKVFNALSNNALSPTLEYGVVELPRGKWKATLAFSGAMVIPKQSAHKGDAWQMFSYLSGKEGMETSDHIHAASLGGIWQILVCGFGGVQMLDGKLRINPKLPPQIQEITYPINWKGNYLKIKVSEEKIAITNTGNGAVNLSLLGQDLTVERELTVKKT